MNSNRRKKGNKLFFQGLLFLLIMGLTFYTIFHGQNIGEIGRAVSGLALPYLCLALFAALFFVAMEGVMIFYLLRSLHGKSNLLQCIAYSFIGFFYSGITPSATGGQPMQLYYMKKDGNSLSDSSVVLLTVALIYKLVLVLIGAGMLLCWREMLITCLQGYFPLFLLGWTLNMILVAILLAVMLAPGWMRKVINSMDKGLTALKIFRKSDERQKKINCFIEDYRRAVRFLGTHKRKVFVILVLTFVQRGSVFLLTWFVYRGFSLKGADFLSIVLLQASVYIAVDMLPIPGAQGITELMYLHVFQEIFTDGYLIPSLYVNRGIGFYFTLIVSLAVVIVNRAKIFIGSPGIKQAG